MDRITNTKGHKQMSDMQTRIRSLATASANGTLLKSLGIGKYILTGWLGGVDEEGKPAPRVRMEQMKVGAKGLAHAKSQYMRQFKNSGLPAEALDLSTGIMIIRVDSSEDARSFAAEVPSVVGVVKFFKEQEGTGYITVDGVDYFVHHAEILCDKEEFPMLSSGQKVSFIPADRNGRNTACSVSTEV